MVSFRGKVRYLGALLICILLLSGCEKQYDNVVICSTEPYNSYGQVISQILPGFEVFHEYQGALPGLKRGAVVEACDPLTRSSMKVGVAEFWYPQYLATVVIAIDRDQTDAKINGWNDLLYANEQVGMSERLPEVRLLLSAVSYGLEGDTYTFVQAAELLATLYHDEMLSFHSYDTPVLICFDYQAVALNQRNRNLEIIIPREGTLIFEKGLLSKVPLPIHADAEKILLEKGFRLPDGRSAEGLYPEEKTMKMLLFRQTMNI